MEARQGRAVLDRPSRQEKRDVIRRGFALRLGERLLIRVVDLGLPTLWRLRRTTGRDKAGQGKEEQLFHLLSILSGNQIRAKKTVTPAPFKVVAGCATAECTITNPAIARKIKGGSG